MYKNGSQETEAGYAPLEGALAGEKSPTMIIMINICCLLKKLIQNQGKFFCTYTLKVF